jgi:hypothetical protein
MGLRLPPPPRLPRSLQSQTHEYGKFSPHSGLGSHTADGILDAAAVVGVYQQANAMISESVNNVPRFTSITFVHPIEDQHGGGAEVSNLVQPADDSSHTHCIRRPDRNDGIGDSKKRPGGSVSLWRIFYPFVFLDTKTGVENHNIEHRDQLVTHRRRFVRRDFCPARGAR